MNPFSPEVLIVVVVVLVLFGGSRIPKVARSLGQASKEFRTGLSEGAKDDDGDKADKADKKAEKTEK